MAKVKEGQIRSVTIKCESNACGAKSEPVCGSCGGPLQQLCIRARERHSERIPDKWGRVDMSSKPQKVRITEWVWYCDHCGPNASLGPCPKCGGSNIFPTQQMVEKDYRNCYVTTACCEFKGLPDDCELMTTLRNFRDTYMMEKYPEEVEQYYAISPEIIEIIEQRNDSNVILENTYRQILEVKEMIDSEQLEEAHRKYIEIVLDLQNKYT